MNEQKGMIEEVWVSIIMRLAVASLFGAACIDKFLGGLQGTVVYFQTLFAETWLPESIVIMQARITPWIELLITVWLLIGIKLRVGWIVASLFAVSLSFGTMVAGDYGIAANNYFFVFLCCIGLYFSKYDRFSIDHLLKK